jgi:hypothetical protein
MPNELAWADNRSRQLFIFQALHQAAIQQPEAFHRLLYAMKSG